MKNNKLLLALVLVLFLSTAFLLFSNGEVKGVQTQFGSSVSYPAFNALSSTTSKLVTTSSTLIQSSTTRQYLAIVNDGSYPIYITCDGGNPAVAYEGIRLNASGGAYEMTGEEGNMCFGAIYGIAVGGNSSTTLVSVSQQ